jgi:site-specific DNA-cytosine methylase
MANERRLSIGSMFSGMIAEAHALKALNVSFNHLFAIDHDKFVCQFIRKNHLTKRIIQQDARSIDLTTLPHVDIFLASPPCQSFSSLGYQDQNKRADLYKVALDYAGLKRPTVFVLENVPAFAKTPQFRHLINCLKSLYRTVKHEILNSACFGSIQARKRLFVVASNADVALPTPGEPKGIPLTSFLDDAALPMLNAKAIAYLHRRKKWGVKIYRRDFLGHVGTIPRSYGHQISWKHVIEEEEGNLRNLTANEAFRIMGYDPSTLVFGKLSKRQRFYLAGNAIELNVLKQVLAAICKTIVGAARK